MRGEHNGAKAASCPEALETLVVRESASSQRMHISVAGAAPSLAYQPSSGAATVASVVPVCASNTMEMVLRLSGEPTP